MHAQPRHQARGRGSISRSPSLVTCWSTGQLHQRPQARAHGRTGTAGAYIKPMLVQAPASRSRGQSRRRGRGALSGVFRWSLRGADLRKTETEPACVAERLAAGVSWVPCPAPGFGCRRGVWQQPPDGFLLRYGHLQRGQQ
jgi:hypothetical protein